MQPSREGKNTIPVYTDVSAAVPYLQRGGYAFHCELTEAFQEIANQFDAYEICELRTVSKPDENNWWLSLGESIKLSIHRAPVCFRISNYLV